MARPKKFTARKKKEFLDLLGKGNTIGSICELMDISASTYRMERLADPEFAAHVDEIKRLRVTLVEDSLYMTALGGNVTAQIFYLCNRDPENWRNVNKVEAEVRSEGRMDVSGRIEMGLDFSGMTEDEIAAVLENAATIAAMSRQGLLREEEHE